MKDVAIVGTYRKGRTIDSAVDDTLRGARDDGIALACDIVHHITT